MIDDATLQMVALLREGGVTGVPCDEFQVQDLEQCLRVELPAAFKAFLMIAGNGFEPFEGSQYAVADDYADLQRQKGRILRKARMKSADASFAFFVHQGYMIRYFYLGD